MTSALLASMAVSDTQARPFNFFQMGTGRSSCADYLTSYENLDAATRKFLRKERVYVSLNNAYDEWIFGFFSAMNYASALYQSDHPSIQISNAELIGAVRDYCAAHPDELIWKSVEHVVKTQWANPSASSAATGDTPGTLVVVDFQPNVSSADVQAFVQAYSVTIVEGPDANGFSKLRLPASLPSDQLQLVLDSMKSQVKIIKSAAAG